MKTIIKYLPLAAFLLCIQSAYGQIDFMYDTKESITPVALRYDTLYPANIEANKSNAVINLACPGVVTYQRSAWSSLAYRLTNSDKWIAFDLDFGAPPRDFRLIDIDNKGKKELFIRGYTLSPLSGDHCVKRNTLMIVSIDSLPMQLLKVVTSCKDTLIDSEGNGEAVPQSYMGTKTAYRRNVILQGNRVIIPEPTLNNQPFGDKNKRNVPAGTYTLKEGRLTKEK